MKSIEEYTQAGQDIYQGLIVGMEGYHTTDSTNLVPVKFLLGVEKVNIANTEGTRNFQSMYIREFVGHLSDGIQSFVGGAYSTEFHDREKNILTESVQLCISREEAREAMSQAVWSMRNGHLLLRTAGVDSVQLHSYDAVGKEIEARDTEERLHMSYTSLASFIKAKQSVGAR